MRNIRLIARLDIKAPNLVKGIQLEGLRKLGDPNIFAKKYYQEGIDEIYFEDIVASLYERNSLVEIIKRTTENVFVPITVGGGLRNINDISSALRSGADKVSINTAAIKNPEIIKKAAKRFGSQSIVLSIQAKKNTNGWEAYFDNGREHSGIDAVDWASRGEELGAGELLVTSVDKEGMAKGFDSELIKEISSNVSIPVIASGGMGKLDHLSDVIKLGGADAVAMAHVLHYEILTLNEIRDYAFKEGIPIRNI
ncbi:MAG: imidazole glycerol phosphate synthase subunit HisF [Gammaproteobacteria bacterium]|nr:imidazole glycerol phosphate synthase subunit HisF [Gammaproteobacteria bacterium]